MDPAWIDGPPEPTTEDFERMVGKLYEENRKLRKIIADALDVLDDCTCDEPEKYHDATNCHVAWDMKFALESCDDSAKGDEK